MKDKKKVNELLIALKAQMTTPNEIKLVEDFEYQLVEEWRDIEGYEGLYQISNYGRVKSFHFGRESILKNQVMKKGYLYVSLFKNHIHKKFLVHILVAKAFIPNPDGKNEVNHKFGDKKDNRAIALEWVTSKENIRSAYELGLIKLGSERFNAKLTDDDIRYIRKNYKFRDKENNMEAFSKKFNVSKSVIHRIIHGKSYANVC